jgi:far upstream element-binding protein
VGVAQVTSQPDYSAQWAEYYRSLGKYKEAEAIEAQMKIKGVEQTASNHFSSHY